MVGLIKSFLKHTGVAIGLVIIILISIFLYQASVLANDSISYDNRNIDAEKVVENIIEEPDTTQKAEETTVVAETATQVETLQESTQNSQQGKNQGDSQTTTAAQTQGQLSAVVVNTTPQPGVALTDTQGKEIAIQNASTYVAQINEVLAITNDYRAQNGLAPLQLDTTLIYAAMHRSAEMAHLDNGSSQVSHTRPNGLSFSSIRNVYGISCSIMGENILDIYDTPMSAMNAWIESPTHRANILGDFTKIGIGVAVAENGVYYWTQLFIR